MAMMSFKIILATLCWFCKIIYVVPSRVMIYKTSAEHAIVPIQNMDEALWKQANAPTKKLLAIFMTLFPLGESDKVESIKKAVRRHPGYERTGADGKLHESWEEARKEIRQATYQRPIQDARPIIFALDLALSRLLPWDLIEWFQSPDTFWQEAANLFRCIRQHEPKELQVSMMAHLLDVLKQINCQKAYGLAFTFLIDGPSLESGKLFAATLAKDHLGIKIGKKKGKKEKNDYKFLKYYQNVWNWIIANKMDSTSKSLLFLKATQVVKGVSLELFIEDEVKGIHKIEYKMQFLETIAPAISLLRDTSELDKLMLDFDPKALDSIYGKILGGIYSSNQQPKNVPRWLPETDSIMLMMETTCHGGRPLIRRLDVAYLNKRPNWLSLPRIRQLNSNCVSQITPEILLALPQYTSDLMHKVVPLLSNDFLHAWTSERELPKKAIKSLRPTQILHFPHGYGNLGLSHLNLLTTAKLSLSTLLKDVAEGRVQVLSTKQWSKLNDLFEECLAMAIQGNSTADAFLKDNFLTLTRTQKDIRVKAMLDQKRKHLQTFE